MTILKKLEDSVEGLIGITEDGKRVHLGAPTAMYCALEDYGYTPFEKAKLIFSPDALKSLQEEKRIKAYHKSQEIYRADDKAYWYPSLDEDLLVVSRADNNNSFAYTHLRFEKQKERTYRTRSDRYGANDGNEPFIKIHREETKKEV